MPRRKRFERITIRRTARFTVYGIYDNDESRIREGLMSSRDIEEVNAEIARLNTANLRSAQEGGEDD